MSPQGTGGLDQAALLEQVSWMRRLARELVADRELAEDLVQETCVVALERAPREPGKLRQWLAEVLRNALRQHARSHGRRRAREASAARDEGLEPTDRLVERVLVQRELMSAVVDLDEPYRSTVLLRFFEELPPREIARRTGVPLATVNSRLQRALARLRERLDGGHRAWAAVLWPWVRGLESIGSPTLLSVLMKTKLALFAGAAALAAGAFAWWNVQPENGLSSAPRDESLEDPAGALAAAGGAAAPAPAERAVGERVARSALPKEGAKSEATPENLAPLWSVRLRVLDAEGLPMAGVAIRGEEHESVLGTSGTGGWCLFQTREPRLVLSAADPSWVTIQAGSPSRSSSIDPVLILAPAVSLQGEVLDEGGRLLGGASVRFELPDGFRTRFSEVLEAGRAQSWRAFSDQDGRFDLPRVPAVPGATLAAVHPGYERSVIEAPVASTRALQLILARPKLPLTGVLRGQVLDTNGLRIEGARVGLGLASVVSDERGAFEIPLERAVTSEVISAVKAGYLPARLERPGEPGPERSGWPDHVVLVLPGPALTIRGAVHDHEGKPVPGAKIWVHDPTPGTPIGQMPSFLEPLMAGAPVSPQALESVADLPDRDGDSFFDWHTNAAEPSALWHWAVTDGSGGFELGGLDERRYKLDVLRKDSLEIATSPSIAAGETSAVIRLDPPDVFERLNGRVVGEDGSPLADVSVRLYRPVIDARARIFGGSSQVVLLEMAGRVATDPEGRFTFEDVPKNGAEISVRADGIVPAKAAVEGESIEFVVEVRCHLQVILNEGVGRFDGFEVADEQGNRLDIMVLSEGSMNAWSEAPLVDGRSGVVSVSSRARELKLLKNGVVVETRRLDLLSGDVNRVEI